MSGFTKTKWTASLFISGGLALLLLLSVLGATFTPPWDSVPVDSKGVMTGVSDIVSPTGTSIFAYNPETGVTFPVYINPIGIKVGNSGVPIMPLHVSGASPAPNEPYYTGTTEIALFDTTEAVSGATDGSGYTGSSHLFRFVSTDGGNYGTGLFIQGRDVTKSKFLAWRTGIGPSNGVNFSLGTTTEQDESFYIIMRQGSNKNAVKIDLQSEMHTYKGMSIGESYVPYDPPTNGLAVEGKISSGVSEPNVNVQLDIQGIGSFVGGVSTYATAIWQAPSGESLFVVGTDLYFSDSAGVDKKLN